VEDCVFGLLYQLVRFTMLKITENPAQKLSGNFGGNAEKSPTGLVGDGNQS